MKTSQHLLLAAIAGLSFCASPSHTRADALDVWLARNSGAANILNADAYGNGIWVAVGGEGTILSSPDGLVWTRRTSGTTAFLNSMVFANGLFVIVGESGTILTSPTGTGWTIRTSGTTDYLYDVSYGAGTYIAVSDTGTVVTSANGVTWTQRSGGTLGVYGVAYGNGRFVAVGGLRRCFNTCYNYSVAYTSADAVTWIQSDPSPRAYLSDVAFGNGIFVAVGDPVANRGTIVTSTNGLNWTDQSSGSPDYLFNVAFGDGTFVVVGAQQGTILTSTNGVNWTPRNSGTSIGLYNVAHGNGTFLVVGNGGTILQSEYVPTGTPYFLTQPNDVVTGPGSNVLFTTTATNDFNLPMSYQWFFNQTNPVGVSSPTLLVPSVGPVQLGGYSVVVSNDFGAVTSRLARLDFADPRILVQPSDLAVKATSNALFTVVATNAANLPMGYQWFFNQTTPVGVSSATLLVTNVGAAQLGGYSVVVSNASGVVTSRVATLDVLYSPVIVAAPQSQTIVAGDNVTFSVTVTNNATLPIGYSWRKGSIVLTNIVLQARTCTFTLFNVATNVTATNGPGGYRVAVTNIATTGQGLASPLVTLTVLQPMAPTVMTLPASDLLPDGATLNASVNPRGAPTVAWFEYGLTPAYGGLTIATNLGHGSSLVAFQQAVTGLMVGTNYHYRVVATNRVGMALGADVVFQTATSVARPTISGYELLGNGQFRLRFDSAPGTTYSVLVSTNLSDWNPLGPASELTPGHFEFTDTDAPGHPTRFYQLRTP